MKGGAARQRFKKSHGLEEEEGEEEDEEKIPFNPSIL